LPSKRGIRKGGEPSKRKSAKQEANSNLPSTCFFSTSRARRPASTARSRPLRVSPCSWRANSWLALVMLSTISSPSSFENSVFRPSSDFCAASRATRSCSSADWASARAARSCWSCPSAPWRAVRSCRSWSSATASAATLASRAAFRSSASLAFCSSARARSSAWLC
jgi:hypothetical protein